MELQKKEIEHIAKLARIELTQEEKGLYSKQLSDILGYINELQKLDISNVADVGQITGLENQLAKDKVVECGISKEDLFKNAPDTKDGYIKVKSVLGRKT